MYIIYVRNHFLQTGDGIGYEIDTMTCDMVKKITILYIIYATPEQRDKVVRTIEEIPCKEEHCDTKDTRVDSGKARRIELTLMYQQASRRLLCPD